MMDFVLDTVSLSLQLKIKSPPNLYWSVSQLENQTSVCLPAK